MGLLRTLAVTGLSTLLLSPLVKTATEDIKQPIIVVAEDVSQSIVSGLSKEQQVQSQDEMTNMISKLSETYEVKTISIGDAISEGKVDSFNANITNLSNALSYIDDNYGDQNLGAIIMATDGIYNEGKNPIYTNTNITAPLYIIAQGDTSVRRDLAVKNVFVNKIAYLGDKFTLQIDIQASNAAGTASNLSVRNVTDKQNVKLHTENIRVNNNSFFTTKEIIVDANRTGVNKIRIALSPVSNEISTVNNYKDIYIEVLDARQKILILADAPHPDLSALRSIISKNKNYESEVKFVSEGNINVLEYDIVILHNLPSDDHDILAFKSTMDSRKIPRLYIIGAETKSSLLNSFQDVIRLKKNGNSTEDIQARVVDNFSSFTLSENLIRTIGKFPALVAPFGSFSDPLGANILLKQKIRDIPTENPLLAFSDKAGYKTGVLVGEGLWKWRLYNYVESQNFDIIEELINKSIQYISTKEDKRKFRASSSKNLYKENEDILFSAQLYNENYEMINEPDVFVSVRNSDNKEYKYTFSKTTNYYTLNANLLPTGKYSYEASTSYNGETLTQKGYFTIQDIQLELYDLTARHGLLKSLSNKYGGNVVLPTELKSLVDNLTGENSLKPTIYTNIKTRSVINFKWIFWSFLLMLCGEWFLRRYMGSY